MTESANSTLAVVGHLHGQEASFIQEAAACGRLRTHTVPGSAELEAWMRDNVPVAVAVRADADAAGAEQTCTWMRAHARHAQVPLLGLVRAPSDLLFTEFFTWGGDDLQPISSPRSLGHRLQALARRSGSDRPDVVDAKRDGWALVVGPDAGWRARTARALNGGAYQIRFLTSAEELIDALVREDVTLVVAVDELRPEGTPALLAKARDAGSETPWVVVAAPKRIAGLRAELSSARKVAIADAFAPPENVLFVANELTSSFGADKRSSARLLYGTCVRFRGAGREDDEIGFTYNISANGMYVRTLAPPEPKTEVWLELWAPRSERRVRLAGEVAWCRPFGPNERATVPAGFGVKITNGLSGDLGRWSSGYGAFANEMLGSL